MEDIKIDCNIFTLGTKIVKFNLPMEFVDDINKAYDENSKDLKSWNDNLAGKIKEEKLVDEILTVGMRNTFLSLFEHYLTLVLNPYEWKPVLDQAWINEMTFDDIFTSKNGQHPPILKMVLAKRINLETFVILEELLSFSKQLNKDISETVLWPKLCDRIERYRPFLKFNITKYRVTLRNKLKDI